MQQVSVKRHLKSTLTKKRTSKHRFRWNFNGLKNNINKENDKRNSINPESGTIFGQVSTQILNNFNAKTLRQPSQAWKVKLIGEGADDAGGNFS